MQRRLPRAEGEEVLVSDSDCVGIALCTGTGSHPAGDWVIFASSRPTRRGMEGPVRSMSRIPTDFPWRDSARASWRVTDDLPTPPLPDKTCRFVLISCSGVVDVVALFASRALRVIDKVYMRGKGFLGW